MAEEMSVELNSDVKVNYNDHKATYDAFIKGSKNATIAVIVVLILLAYFFI